MNLATVTLIYTFLADVTCTFVPYDLVARQLASGGGKIPTEDDYKGAAQGIVRLQKVYNLHIDDVISGNVSLLHDVIL